MNYLKPTTVEEAVKLLAANADARCLAGGASLVAMMNAELVEPSALISLKNIKELDGINVEDDGSVSIGPMTKHKAVVNFDGFLGSQDIVRIAARHIGHPPIRRMGTIGGSIANADPAADYPTALTVVNAIIKTFSSKGERLIPAGEFFIDFMETALEPGEIVRSITIPAGPADAIAVYDKLARVDGDFATVSVAVVLTMDGSNCSFLKMVIGGCDATPVHVTEADDKLIGTDLNDTAIAKAAAIAAEACDPMDDVRASAQYRLKVLPRLINRTIDTARQKWEVR